MKTEAVVGGFGRIVYALCLIAVGAVLAINGAQLIYLGGSFYYLPIGIAAALAGVAAIFGKWRSGAAVYFALMVVTLVCAHRDTLLYCERYVTF